MSQNEHRDNETPSTRDVGDRHEDPILVNQRGEEDKGADNNTNGDDDGFVVVGAPMPSVTDFAEWVQKERIPNTQSIASGSCDKDEMSFLVDRKSFLRDALRSFERSAKMRKAAKGDQEKEEEAGSDNSPVGVNVSSSVWTELWSQFERDVPRQEFVFLDDAKKSNQKWSSAGDLAAAVKGFLEQHSDQLKEEMGKHTTTAPATEASASTSSLSRWLWPWGASSTTTSPTHPPPHPSSLDDHLQHVLRLVVLFSQQGVLALPLEIFNQEFCVGNNDEDWTHPEQVETRLNRSRSDPAATTTAVNFSSASSSSPPPQLFVGEVSEEHEDEVPMRGMRIVLKATKQQAPTTATKQAADDTSAKTPSSSSSSRVRLEVQKTLRVFSLVDMTEDYSLFFIDSSICIDVFGHSDDPIEIKWRTRACKNPLAAAKGRRERAQKAREEADREALKEMLRKEEQEKKEKERAQNRSHGGASNSGHQRQCDCLGASSGFHKSGCAFA